MFRTVLVQAALLLAVVPASAADWPQWLGPNRDAKVSDFKAPGTWPKELSKKWSVTVGDGVSTPALVGDKLFVFGRVGGDEVIRCLKADSGDEVWQDKYPAKGVGGPAAGYQGPRASPAVSDGMVVTLGVQGTLSCYDAAKGTKLWRKDDTGSLPRFANSSSPFIVDGLCIMQFGGESKGGILAFDLKTGEQKWKWDGEGTAYASPVLLTVDGMKVIIAETSKTIAAVSLTDGKKLWDVPFTVTGRGYNASTPMAVGQTLIYSGSNRGTKALKVEKKGDGIATTELWNNKEVSVIYNTPILKDDFVYGLTSSDNVFCIDAKTGKTAWTSKIKGSGGYGTVLNAGEVLFALTPAGEMVVFSPGGTEFKEVAKYKVATGGTHSYPLVAGDRIYIKDKTSLTLWKLAP